MNPCSKNRKLIAWLAVDALDAEQAMALRDHFTRCEGCRGYWVEISNVTQGLKAAPSASNLEATESFHRRVAERLKAAEPSSGLENPATWLRGLLNWRVAVPATAVLVIAIIALVAPPRPPTASVSAPPPVQVTASPESGNDLSPTLANYQMVANQSLDKLDKLLIQQGNKPLPPVPPFDLANASF